MKYCVECGGLLDEKTGECPQCKARQAAAAQGGGTGGYVAYLQPVPLYGQEIVPKVIPVTPAREHAASSREIVHVEGLCKRYSKKADWAVTDVTFSCYEGEIVGLLGHNGAGKSTTLKCLEGMLPFEKGKITIAGYDIKRQAEKAKKRMGFVTDDHATFVKMTGMQYLNFMADIYEVPSKERVKRLKELDAIFQLGKPIENMISSYSHGMRQKICMMGSLMHKPKLWILDEPMTGLDPRTMRAVQDFMHKYVAAGNSIIFSSHALNTVAKLCDRVVLIRKGKQVNELDMKAIYGQNPNFDFEDYFLRNEGKEE